MSSNTIWHAHKVCRGSREILNGHKACLLWFTGLSGSGKSTIAGLVEEKLHDTGKRTYLLDGDNVRKGMNKDLGFSDSDRVENIRRIGEMSRLFVDAGIITLSAFISPFRSERRSVRELMPEGDFIEVFVDSPLATCEQRDPKGLYQRARQGEIQNFTGIDSPYETPEKPEIHVINDGITPDEAANAVIDYLVTHGYI
ncbi:adenylyl-sulfate kinase [Halomonas sp. M4R1S46]|uniref:adenylyl-sulfate kinase n=1 Tax=Halomonas sp. M4R1S46 TaxID=2982692 RepID=UPI0029650053|nr:adenylyl-sulfate kinase [Halomonas sp. M4R1S46]